MTNQITPTVLISDGRSGTNFLISKLLQTGKVHFGREPFNTGPNRAKDYGGQDGPNVPKTTLGKMNDTAFRDSDPDGYIDYCAGFTGALDDTGATVSGFKIFPSHNRDIYWKMSRDARFKPVVLQRKSVLAVYSSLLIAKKTRKWVQLHKDQKPNAKQVKVRFNPKGFEDFRQLYVGRFLRVEDNLRRNGVDYCKTYYEDLISNADEMARVFAFLGLKPKTDQGSPIAVQNTPNILDRFENPEDARPYLEKEIRENAKHQPERGALTLHIGPPKTGTTALQIAIQTTKVPNFAYLGTFQPRTRNNGIWILGRLLTACRGDMPDDFIARLLCTIETRLKAGTDLLVSEEMFLVDQPMATYDEKLVRLGDVCGRFNPEILLTPREPISATKSLYGELYFRQTHREKIDFDTFVNGNQSKIYDYTHLLQLLKDNEMPNVRVVKIERGEATIPLSRVTGKPEHSQTLDLEIANETEAKTKDDIGVLTIPKAREAHLTQSYKSAMKSLNAL